MELIETVEGYRALLRETREKLGKTDTNCFLMETQVKSYIQQGRLFCKHFSDGILMLVDELNFYSSYYLWKPGAPFADIKMDRPLLLCEYDSNGRRLDYIHAMEEKLLGCGFSLLKVSEMAVLDTNLYANKKGQREYVERLASEGLKILECRDETLQDKIISLWDRTFSATDIVLDDRAFLQNERMSVHCIVNDSDDVVSVGAMYYQGNGCQFRHVVTAPQYRHRGLGEALAAFRIEKALENGVKEINVFINEDNIASWRLHEKSGFRHSGKTSRQYVRNSINY